MSVFAYSTIAMSVHACLRNYMRSHMRCGSIKAANVMHFHHTYYIFLAVNMDTQLIFKVCESCLPLFLKRDTIRSYVRPFSNIGSINDRSAAFLF